MPLLTAERDYRAEKRRENRAMDKKSRNEFKPRSMRSEFQNIMHDEFPRRQFEDFVSEAGSDDDKRRDKSSANRLCTVRVADEIGPPIPGNRYGLDANWAHFSSVSEFPQNARNLTTEQYVQIGNLQATARAARYIEESLTKLLGQMGNDEIDEILGESILNAQIV